MITDAGIADFYNAGYKQQNYFCYRSWIHGPYVLSLIAFCDLKKGSSGEFVGESVGVNPPAPRGGFAPARP